MSKEKVHFEVSSSLKSIVGKDLITDDFVAIFELVKNSIDAGATKIDVIFELEGDTPSIWIVDNGKGMSEADIRNKWLFVGYSAKREGTEDKVAKSYAGNKGVGRFSCDRLGKNLTIQTKVQGKREINLLSVNWRDYERDSKKKFTDIDINYEKREAFTLPENIQIGKTGVVIQITDLRDLESWKRPKLEKLRQSLAKLINPFGEMSDGVQIIVFCERELEEDQSRLEKSEFPVVVNGVVENDILEVLEQKSARIRVAISEAGRLVTELRDRGELIYKISEPVEGELGLLKDSKFRADIYYLNTSAKTTFFRRMGVKSKDFGSVLLFKNGFQVYPVGEEGNDYWNLDKRKSQGHSRFLGNRDVIGRVDVTGDEDKFLESSSRDKGLIQTKEAFALSKTVIEIIKRFERYVVGVTWQDALDKNSETSERLHLDQNRSRIIDLVAALTNSKDVELLDYNTDLVSVLNSKSESYEETLKPLRKLLEKTGDKELSKTIEIAEKTLKKAKREQIEAEKYAEKEAEARQKAEQIADEAKKEAEAATGAYEEEKKRNLFLTRNEFLDKDLLESFLHQIDIYASDQRISLENFQKRLSRAGAEKIARTQVVDIVSNLKVGIEKIVTTARYATLANFRLDSGKITSDVPDFIHEYLEKIAPLYHSKITIEVSSKGNFEGTFSPVEFGMFLDNFISNSRKAHATKISFSARARSGICALTITDDGNGIASGIADPKSIFEKGVTRTKGSGLGLYFCNDFVKRMGGELVIVDRQPSDGMEFKLTLSQ